METKKRMKFAIEPFNEGVDSDFSFEGAVKDVFGQREIRKNSTEEKTAKLLEEIKNEKKNKKNKSISRWF